MAVEFIIGAAIGAVGGALAKDKLMDNSQGKVQTLQRENDGLCAENEKFHQRNKELERQVEDLLAENQKLRKQYKEKDDNQDDLQDDLDDARKEVKKLRSQNDTLCNKIQEYKAACEHYELEIARLKDRDN